MMKKPVLYGVFEIIRFQWFIVDGLVIFSQFSSSDLRYYNLEMQNCRKSGDRRMYELEMNVLSILQNRYRVP